MDDSPTSLFTSYEQDFQQLLQGVREKLDGEGRGEQRKAALRKVEMELDEAEEMISQMEIELQGIPQSLKQPYTQRLKSAKSALASAKKRSKDLFTQLARSDLLQSSPASQRYPSDDPYGEDGDRTRLLRGTERLEDGSRRLQSSQAVALQTEELGADILGNLRVQREQIENSGNVLQRANTSIEKASSTLKQMIRRMYQQRFIMAGIIVILVALIIIIVWAKLRR